MKDLKYSVEDWENAYQNKVFSVIHRKLRIDKYRSTFFVKLVDKYPDVDPTLFMETVFPPYGDWYKVKSYAENGEIVWEKLRFPFIPMLLTSKAKILYDRNLSKIQRTLKEQGDLSEEATIVNLVKTSLERLSNQAIDLDNSNEVIHACVLHFCSPYVIYALFDDVMVKLALFSKSHGLSTEEFNNIVEKGKKYWYNSKLRTELERTVDEFRKSKKA